MGTTGNKPIALEPSSATTGPMNAMGDRRMTLPAADKCMEQSMDVLVIDDNVDFAENLAEILRGVGASAQVAFSLAEARAQLKDAVPHILFVDMRLPDGSGEDLVAELAESSPASLSIVLTGNATIQSAVASVNSGAFGFLLKDMPVEAILAAYDRAVERIHLVQQKSDLEAQLGHSEQLAAIGQMAATLAHEIKNPLTGISHALQVLLDAVGEPPEMQGLKESILKRFGRLNLLVEDLLEFSKPMNVKREAVDLAGMISEIVDAHSELEIEIDLEVDGTVALVDGNLFRMLLRNLVENAVIATSSSTDPKVSVVAGRTGTDLRLQVSDNGEGIPTESLGDVFKPFFTTRTRGTGLGLSLAARIVEAHGGALTAANQEESGAVFHVQIPSAFQES